MPVFMPPLPAHRSLDHNGLGAEGAKAIAAVLKDSQLSSLRCAAAPTAPLARQGPLNT